MPGEGAGSEGCRPQAPASALNGPCPQTPDGLDLCRCLLDDPGLEFRVLQDVPQVAFGDREDLLDGHVAAEFVRQGGDAASRMPQGMILSNHLLSGFTFSAKPCIVTPLATRMPMAAILRSSRRWPALDGAYSGPLRRGRTRRRSGGGRSPGRGRRARGAALPGRRGPRHRCGPPPGRSPGRTPRRCGSGPPPAGGRATTSTGRGSFWMG